jgi:quinol-cytochrome oxidoreductase complex cytochrome b subunit
LPRKRCLSGFAQSAANEAVLGWVLLLFVLGPALTGLCLGLTARRKQAVNPATLWIAIVWNAILVASFVVLTLIGLTREG